ncbi:hypothetical protein H1C71_014998 [Ictidomys tridecemlineatus]|nr:hypothetical protein H1C71_014998 [Ictidomys tridecemlineatus]KAG3293433.1 hypothetical protein H1C71_014998 [Ictidomys tridecemlineatus]
MPSYFSTNGVGRIWRIGVRFLFTQRETKKSMDTVGLVMGGGEGQVTISGQPGPRDGRLFNLDTSGETEGEDSFSPVENGMMDTLDLWWLLLVLAHCGVWGCQAPCQAMHCGGQGNPEVDFDRDLGCGQSGPVGSGVLRRWRLCCSESLRQLQDSHRSGCQNVIPEGSLHSYCSPHTHTHTHTHTHRGPRTDLSDKQTTQSHTHSSMGSPQCTHTPESLVVGGLCMLGS